MHNGFLYLGDLSGITGPKREEAPKGQASTPDSNQLAHLDEMHVLMSIPKIADKYGIAHSRGNHSLPLPRRRLLL